MLGFSGGIAFGVNLGNFFQLKSSIHRDRVVDGAAEEHEIVDAIVKLGEFLDLVGGRQDRFRLLRNREKFGDVLLGRALSRLFP